MRRIVRRRPTNRDVQPLDFERLSSRAADIGRGWNVSLPLPQSVRLRITVLPSYNRTLDPQFIERESRDMLLKLCDRAGVHTVVPLTPEQERKKQLKGFIAYSDFVCDLASLELSNICKPIKADKETHSAETVKEGEEDKFISDKLQSLFDKLSAFKKIEDVDDEYTFKPTQRAYIRTKLTLMSVYQSIGKQMPLPRIVSDGDGGLVAAWQRDNRIVRLRFRADDEPQDYIYYQSEDDYDVESVTINNLKKRLEWLLEV